MRIDEAMAQLAADLQPHISRLVTHDPTRAAAAPCVIVELPVLDGRAVLCGDYLAELPVIVVGQPGAAAELGPLAVLLEETLNALATIGVVPSRVEPIQYVPLAESNTADPCMSYRITTERYV